MTILLNVRVFYFIRDWFSLFRIRNLNAMPEVREKVFDPDPNKANIHQGKTSQTKGER